MSRLDDRVDAIMSTVLRIARKIDDARYWSRIGLMATMFSVQVAYVALMSFVLSLSADDLLRWIVFCVLLLSYMFVNLRFALRMQGV